MTKDIKLSNVKGLLILLVVFGHLIEPYKNNFMVLYLFIYSFHMPLFVFISGYFAKRANIKKTMNLLFVYLIFQPLYQGFNYIIQLKKPYGLHYDVPYFHLWYLLSMVAWYLFAIAIKKTRLLRMNKAVLSIILIALAIGSKYAAEPIVAAIDNIDPSFYSYTLSYQRTISFLPFFIIGLSMSEATMKKLQTSLKSNRILAAAGVSILFLYIMFADHTNLEKILKGSYGIDRMKGSINLLSVQIILGYLIAIAMCYLLLNLIKSQKSFLTRLGDRSLPIYLFHAVFIMVEKKVTLMNTFSPALLLLILSSYTIFIVWFLSTAVFIRATNFLYNPSELITKTVNKLKVA